MNWKNWPYWVKGGVAGFSTSIAFFLSKLAITTSDVAPPICNYVGAWEILGKRCSTTEFIIMNYKEEVIVTTILFAALSHFYGKFKNRKQLNSGSPPARG